MRNIGLISMIFLLLTIGSNANSALEWRANTASGVQVSNSFRGMTRATGLQTNMFYGSFTLAAGYDLTCVDSLTSHLQHSASDLVPLFEQSVYIARTDPQSGWDSWEPGSVNQCNLNWRHLIKDGTGFSLFGLGMSISLGGAEEPKAGTFFGFMLKPEIEEDLLACVISEDGEGEFLCGDPILVDLNNDGFNFTSLDEGVLFDIDADGVKELTAWTRYQGDDAFLFLDLNDNGVVDDGSELFGDRTMLLSSEFAIDGYDALSELDQKGWGGNGDQLIDVRDRYFGKLGLWNDWNQNGYSEPDEMITLRAFGIKTLSLELEYFDVIDEHGNWIEFASWAYTKLNLNNPNQTTYRVADVYLQKREILQ